MKLWTLYLANSRGIFLQPFYGGARDAREDFGIFYWLNQGCTRMPFLFIRIRHASIRIRPYPPKISILMSVSADIRPRISVISE